MEKFKSKVGNTIEFIVDVGTSGVTEDIELELFLQYSYSDGFTESIGIKTPNQFNAGEALFIFDTDAVITVPDTLFMHFRATKDSMKLNDYFQIKFGY